MAVVNWVILIAGVAGLLVAGYGLVTLTTHAVRARRYGDIAIGVAVVVASSCCWWPSATASSADPRRLPLRFAPVLPILGTPARPPTPAAGE